MTKSEYNRILKGVYKRAAAQQNREMEISETGIYHVSHYYTPVQKAAFLLIEIAYRKCLIEYLIKELMKPYENKCQNNGH